MKRLLIAGVALGWMIPRASGQHPDPPPIEWQQTFGGSQDETLTSLEQTLDGGFILGGYSSSGTDGNKTAPARGNNDFWVVDLNAKGDPLWDQTFGGGGRDVLYSLSGTRDGGLIFGGDTLFSVNGNKTSALI